MGLLDELKQKADAIRAEQAANSERLSAHAQAIEEALRLTYKYLLALGRELSVIQPPDSGRYQMVGVGVLPPGKLTEFHVDYRRAVVEGVERFVEVFMLARHKSDAPLTVKCDLTSMERVREQLWRHQVEHTSEQFHTHERVLTHEVFSIRCDFPVILEFSGDAATGTIRLDAKNFKSLGSQAFQFLAGELDDKALEELARELLGQQNRLRDYLVKGVIPDYKPTAEKPIPDYEIHHVPDEAQADERAGVLSRLRRLLPGGPRGETP